MKSHSVYNDNTAMAEAELKEEGFVKVRKPLPANASYNDRIAAFSNFEMINEKKA